LQISAVNAPLAGQTLTYDYTIEEMVSKPLDQLRKLVRLYAGKDMEIAMDGDKATVTLPLVSTMTAAGSSGAGGSSTRGSSLLTALARLFLGETFRKPEKKEE
jgi:FKBP-type peptidyl-prolyl cis-trans isomerase SlyD